MTDPTTPDRPERPGPLGWVREVVLDCPDPEALAGFWAGVVGGEPTCWYDGWWTLEPPPHGQRLSFQRSDRPPRPDEDGRPVSWRVYRDPAGHAFCLVVR